MTLENAFREYDELFEIINSILLKSNECWKNNKSISDKPISDRLSKDYKAMIKLKPPQTYQGFQSIVNAGRKDLSIDFDGNAQYFYLPPSGRHLGFVMLLSISCDFKKEPWKIDIRVEMYQNCQSMATLNCLAMRFESPHEYEEHNYWHCQLTKEINNGPRRGEKIAPPWFPDSWPCLPILAQCPLSLILATISSLYGRKGLSLFVGEKMSKEHRCRLHYKILFSTPNLRVD
jgi:hypothetical protein